ncbi:transketolase [Aeoliella mucimassa]|uniref:Transketolase n=1 Tax=Aeoliella mucimassa TaxID=2527972 RepID=A0A518AP28_9BACT|nr:transketolase [Aeoliella mucimassa]QDU56478.1 Transketolase [Aeoliella mucimassa]
MSTATESIDQLAINTIRTLSMDAVQAANSGHPGTPMALAPIAYEVWANQMTYDPAAPLWPNRDRYVLSCGHASMLIYSMIHLAGVHEVDASGKSTGKKSLTVDDLKQFRQFGSKTPGHPEYKHTAGVETTTGPLGQGCANSVGMAMAQKWLASRYNKDGFDLFDYKIYVQCSDGDLMEGVACEAASLAGHLKLDNVCWIYDDNEITIEGDTSLAFSEDVAKRFEGLGWTVCRVDDANDLSALSKAIELFKQDTHGPTLIIVKSVIGFGAPNKAGTHGAHGAPLGEEEIAGTKKNYGWPNEKFYVPDGVEEHFTATLGARGAEAREKWEALLADYRKQYADLAGELDAILAGELPAGWDKDLPVFPADEKGMATRSSSGKTLNALAPNLPWLIGGSADLAPSNNTNLTDAGDFGPKSYAGRNLHFGIREHAMAAAGNGMALAGLRTYVATFFVFSDYLRPSMRLSSIMGLPLVYVFTHDSIGVGEDGPTHQPVEQLSAARGIPHLIVLRPGDANECVEAWKVAVTSKTQPVALVLTRQNLPTLCREKFAPAAGTAKGGYVLADAKSGKPDVILIATGSELSLAVEAYEQLTADGVAARVVSMPSFELFEQQDAAYRESVLPAAVKNRVGVEAGIRQGWDRYLGFEGTFIGMNDFGASAPYSLVYEDRGITTAAVVEAAKNQLA